ncbi:LolA-related protein [Methylococcus geothermalis]|uniref:Outer membrane lipoprotein carrier protein LolA n=1 Tax=Methylococcus geothermalis TaxID=2681310 RepID=A0A858QAB4_9GAMM|nr:LolA-related protein [Methylococcus geothermalis]QJD30837.1 outer membrane lipoprotein carrier protein LolA [Methylococcus geothermalis]
MGFRAGFIGFFLALIAFATAAQAEPWSLAQLMRALAAQTSGTAEFVEKKYVSVLTEPVESSGELSFAAPDRLEKRTIRPLRERLVLEGERLSLERGSERRSVGLDEYPEIAALVGSIRSTLMGDCAALEKIYRLSLNGDARRWTLLLVPSTPAVAERVAYIRIGGSDGRVDRVEIHQPGGDYSVMSIREIPQR